MLPRYFVACFFFNGWANIQLGLHVALDCPNMEIHVPFGFFRVGWEIDWWRVVNGQGQEPKKTRRRFGFIRSYENS